MATLGSLIPKASICRVRWRWGGTDFNRDAAWKGKSRYLAPKYYSWNAEYIRDLKVLGAKSNFVTRIGKSCIAICHIWETNLWVDSPYTGRLGFTCPNSPPQNACLSEPNILSFCAKSSGMINSEGLPITDFKNQITTWTPYSLLKSLIVKLGIMTSHENYHQSALAKVRSMSVIGWQYVIFGMSTNWPADS